MTLRPDEKLRLVIPVHASAVVWLTVLGAVQLALRHPKYTGPSRELAIDFAKKIRDRLQEEGVLSADEVAEMFRDEMMHQNRPGGDS